MEIDKKTIKSVHGLVSTHKDQIGCRKEDAIYMGEPEVVIHFKDGSSFSFTYYPGREEDNSDCEVFCISDIQDGHSSFENPHSDSELEEYCREVIENEGKYKSIIED